MTTFPTAATAARFVLLLLLPSLTSGQRTPTIAYISPTIHSRIRGTIELECSVLYSAKYAVLWQKLPPRSCKDEARGDVLTGDFRKAISSYCSPIPLSHNSALIITDNRFSLRYDTASSTYTLQIKDVQRSDEALYQCEIVLGNNNKVVQSTKVTISQPPVIYDNSTRSVVVTESDPAELLCYANGAPAPQVSWRRENNAVLPTGGIVYRGNVFKIHSVKKEDRGTYYCVADNGIGRPARRNVAINVEFPPVVTVPTERIGQALGYGVELVCHVEAFPRATIAWVHDGIQLSTNQRFVVDNGFAMSDDFVETSVRVRRLGPRETGSYFCRAKNKLGGVEREVIVVEAYQPDCAVGRCEDYVSEGTRRWRPSSLLAFLPLAAFAAAFAF